MTDRGELAGLDWPGLMRIGLRGLRLRPTDFWAMTPAELLIVMGADVSADAPMGRDRLEALSRAFPDVRPLYDPTEKKT